MIPPRSSTLFWHYLSHLSSFSASFSEISSRNSNVFSQWSVLQIKSIWICQTAKFLMSKGGLPERRQNIVPDKDVNSENLNSFKSQQYWCVKFNFFAPIRVKIPFSKMLFAPRKPYFACQVLTRLYPWTIGCLDLARLRNRCPIRSSSATAPAAPIK